MGDPAGDDTPPDPLACGFGDWAAASPPFRRAANGEAPATSESLDPSTSPPASPPPDDGPTDDDVVGIGLVGSAALSLLAAAIFGAPSAPRRCAACTAGPVAALVAPAFFPAGPCDACVPDAAGVAAAPLVDPFPVLPTPGGAFGPSDGPFAGVAWAPAPLPVRAANAPRSRSPSVGAAARAAAAAPRGGVATRSAPPLDGPARAGPVTETAPGGGATAGDRLSAGTVDLTGGRDVDRPRSVTVAVRVSEVSGWKAAVMG